MFQTFARSQQRTWGWASAQRVRASCRLLSKQLESINLAYLDNRGTTCCSSRQLGVKKLISTSDPPVQNGQQHMLCLSHHRAIMNGFHPTAGESGAVSLTLYYMAFFAQCLATFSLLHNDKIIWVFNYHDAVLHRHFGCLLSSCSKRGLLLCKKMLCNDCHPCQAYTELFRGHNYV